MLKLGCTLPNLANICLHKSTDAKFYRLTEADRDLFEKFEMTSLVARLSFLHAKQLLMKLLSESLQTYANLLLGLMQTTPLLDVSTHAHRSLYALGIRFRNQ